MFRCLNTDSMQILFSSRAQTIRVEKDSYPCGSNGAENLSLCRPKGAEGLKPCRSMGEEGLKLCRFKGAEGLSYPDPREQKDSIYP